MKRMLLPLLLLASLPAQAAVFQVTKTADTLDGACDHDCSLREAVTGSNAAAGKDFVVLGPGVYELTRPGPFEDASATGDLDVLGPLVIVGAGADRTVLDGSQIDRVLHAAGPDTLEVHGVTVRNGWARGSGELEDAGGGILAGSLLVVDSVVSGNRAQDGGGIWAMDLTARGTTVSGNEGNAGSQGGGISVGTVRLSNVTLSGNRASRGGGMFRTPAVDGSEIADTTVTGNAATEAGGGLYTASDFLCPSDGSTCPPQPFIRIERSIVAGNTAGNTAPEKPDCANLENEGSSNVFGVGESCLAGPTDRAGTLAAPLDPRLGPLADNGGPTPTHALLPGSPALDLAPPGSCPPTDQRRRPRPEFGFRCDAGAFEVSPGCQPSDEALCLTGNRFRATVRWTAQGDSGAGRAIPLTSDTGAFWFFDPDNLEMEIKVLNGCGLNDRFWIFLSGLTDVEVEVTVEDTATGQTWEHRHAGGSPLPTLLDTGALGGCAPGGNGVGNAAHPPVPPGSVFRVTRTNDVLNGNCDEADCSLREAVLAANEHPGADAIVLGPGVYTLSYPGRGEDASLDGDLDVAEDLVILGAGAETTVLDGGGIDRVLHVLRAGSLEIHGVTLRNGRAEAGTVDFGSGGGILADGPVTVVRSLVTGNRAEWYGGGIFDFGRLTVRDSTISDNVAHSGGGLYDWREDSPNPSSKLRLTNVTISGNRADYAGGAAVDHKDTEIAHLTVTGNHATRSWGGFLRNECGCIPEDTGCCGSSHFVMSGSLIAGNTAVDGAPDCDILENDGGFNLYGIGTYCRHKPTDLAGSEAAPLDPRLSPLGDHGGPTPTHLPLPGSPAIDAVREGCAGTDQRGVPRPAGVCDAGAVEVSPGCLPGPTRLCLQDGRFAVTVRWTAQGTSGPGRTVPLTADTGAFWFFDRANLEVTVKVLDGCALGGHYWIFLSGLTDVGVEVTVEDTATGNTWTHNHAAGMPLQPRLDTNALNCVNL
jgi:CSLREA domain-containing protein